MAKTYISRKSEDRLQLEKENARIYADVWNNEHMWGIIKLYSRISNLIPMLEEKGIEYKKLLKSATKFSPLENEELRLPPEKFEKMLAETNLAHLKRIHEDFSIILAWVEDGHCVRNLHNFVAQMNYALANHGKRRFVCGQYDPDLRSGGNPKAPISKRAVGYND